MSRERIHELEISRNSQYALWQPVSGTLYGRRAVAGCERETIVRCNPQHHATSLESQEIYPRRDKVWEAIFDNVCLITRSKAARFAWWPWVHWISEHLDRMHSE